MNLWYSLVNIFMFEDLLISSSSLLAYCNSDLYNIENSPVFGLVISCYAFSWDKTSSKDLITRDLTFSRG